MASHPIDEERIFHTARLLPANEARDEYLDQICVGDRALRDRVVALLEVHEKEQSLLQSNGAAEATASHTPVTEQPGEEIGRYKLLQKIGEGGFGVVFMAEQIRPVRRKVALKIIKPGMDTSDVVARFDAERQALAMMDHPHIARVLDGGATDSGRPYFVMELVKGVPITAFCDKNQLSTTERLQLFAYVCQAVQHAHHKGIIHRDLKPSNVLVTLADGKPIVKVIDFGIAKAVNQRLTERTLFTAFGQMVGTPQYMSPEQAEMSCLDVDTRSDVYSLGVLLYELLTGTTPLEAERLRTAGYAELQRIIREEEPPKPSTRLSTSGDKLTDIAKQRSVSPEKLKHQLQGDLDWIVMKALEKDRNRRYESPNNLAGDLANYLENEPITARPPTIGYRTSKYLRRHRVAVAFVVLLLIGLVGTATQAIRARIQAQKAETTLAEWRSAQSSVLNSIMEQVSMDLLVHDLDSVEAKLRVAIKLEADPGWVTLRKGQLAFHRGNFEEALDLLEQAQKQNPKDTVSYALALICKYYAGLEHPYLLEVENLENWPADDFEELVFRGFAQTVAQPGLAVKDLRLALDKDSRHAVVHLLYASALRRLAADTADAEVAYEIAREATEEAFVAKKILIDNPLAIAEFIHANIVLANLCKKRGPNFQTERRTCIAIARDAVIESMPLQNSWVCHLARVSFYDQFGTPAETADALFAAEYDYELRSQQESTVVFRRAWHWFYEHEYVKAKKELEALKGSFADNTEVMFPAIIEMSAATSADQLEGLQSRIAPQLRDQERESAGMFAHFDWVIARLLMLDALAQAKAETFRGICQDSQLDFAKDFEPISRLMCGEQVRPTKITSTKSNRVLAESLFLLGVDYLAKGNRRQAEHYFQKCLETDNYRFFAYWWSKAFLDRLDDPSWLPWLPNDQGVSELPAE